MDFILSEPKWYNDKVQLSMSKCSLFNLCNILNNFGKELVSTTVDQLMFAAINVRVLANQSISPAINVRDLGSQ